MGSVINIIYLKGVVMSMFSSDGLTDWYLQRVTTVFVSAYVIPLLLMWVMYPQMDLATWMIFLKSPVMIVIAILAWCALAVHAYIGLWVVVTDYISDQLVLKIPSLTPGFISKARCASILIVRMMVGLSAAAAVILLLYWSIM